MYFHYIATKLHSSNACQALSTSEERAITFPQIHFLLSRFCHFLSSSFFSPPVHVYFGFFSLTHLHSFISLLVSIGHERQHRDRYKGSNSVKVNKIGIHTGVWNEHTDGKRENKQTLVAGSFELQLQPTSMRMHTLTPSLWLVHYPIQNTEKQRGWVSESKKKDENKINQMIYALPYEHFANNNNHKFLLF